MKINLDIDNSQLIVLNEAMDHLDTIIFANVGRRMKSSVVIAMELRDELLQKALKTRRKTEKFKLKIDYYKADALWNYLNEFEIFFPDSFGTYEHNVVNAIKSELHEKLQ